MIILLIVITIGSVQFASYYDLGRFFQSKSSPSGVSGNHGGSNSGNSSSTSTIEVYTLINFGNGTLKWFNNSNVPIGSNFYNLTLYLTHGTLESTYYPDLQEHLITGIDGVRASGSFYWGLWQFCAADQAWLYSNIGADGIHLSNEQVLSWFYESNDNPPILGAKTVTTC